MKKNILISIILSLAVLISCFSFPVNAAEIKSVSNTTVEYFDDGSYAVITITEEINNSRASVKTGTKTYTHKNSDGEIQWIYEIKGTFSYTGTSSTCTSVSDSYSISDDSWHMVSHSCSRSGNQAKGTVTMKRKLFNITVETVTKNLTLTCSATGVLS